MNKEKRRVPKLRFPGFTEDWEQRELCQITTRVTRKNGGQSDLPLTISAQDGLVDQRKYFNRQVASRDMSNYYLIKKGEFAYNKSYSEGYPFGAVKRLDYYDIGALSTLYILFEITDNNISSDFIVSYYMTHLWYKEISKRAAEGARNHGLLNISTEDFFDSELNIPNSIEEQVKIGNFIKQLDKFITLHLRKLDNLKLKKKALLQKLFPKNGERYPELRFPGFTDAWEQREFSDIFAEVKSGLSRMLSNDDIGLPVVRANNINDGQLNLVDDIKYWYKNDPQGANTNNYLIEQGDILINFINSEAKMGTAAYVTRRPERDTIYTTNILRCKVNDEYNPYFIYSLTFLNSYKNYIASITKPAVNQASFTTVDFKKYSIKIPTVKEQNQIADLIETFNKLITLHQRKLDHLQLQKKALLQQMFV